jgi:hypothetical protein
MSATTIPAGRALHLVDLENLLGNPWATGARVAEAYEAALVAGRHRPGDLVYVAANRWLLAELGFVAHTPCRLLVASGPDGADLVLLEQAQPTWVAERFDRLVIVSGDGIFASVAHAARASGLQVDVVRGASKVSRRLQGLCPKIERVAVPRSPSRSHRVVKVKGRR